MVYENYINLDSKALDKKIYRIFPIGRFIQLLTTKKLTLVKPKLWDDPFENFMLSARFKFGGKVDEMSAQNFVFGQCWTWHRETDAMWRIYSPNKDGVRLSSTPRKLLNALAKSNPQHWELKCFIGQVNYEIKKNMKDKLSEIDIFNTNGSGIPKSLLIKRKEFSHEKEVRLIYVGDEEHSNRDIFEFSINPSSDIDRVLFDPRQSDELRKSYIKAIRALGYDSQIRRSSLYDPPESFTFGILN